MRTANDFFSKARTAFWAKGAMSIKGAFGNPFNHREPNEFGEGATMVRIPKRRGWEITGYAILAWAALALVLWAVVNLTP